MKFLNKASIYTLALLAATAISSCKDNKEGGEPSVPENDGTKVSITTEVITNSPVITDFAKDQTMNVFVKKTASATGDNFKENVKGTALGGGEWELSPAIYINQTQRNVFFYAAYPYVEGLNDVTAYPVDLSKQADVLYSGDYAAVSLQTTKARVRMKHALSMVSAVIDASSYNGSGTVTSMGISGSAVYLTGKLNVSTGKITVADSDKGIVTASMSQDVKSGSANLWVIPFSTKTSDAAFNFTIDGKNYVVDMPEVEMKTGYQYVFHFILTPNGLVVRPDVIDEISLNAEGDNSDTAEGYGSIKFITSASSFTFPIFTGENVFGNVVSGDKSVNYSLGGSMELSASGSKTVTIETWSSTGFELQSLEDIESIDISNY